MSMAASPRSSEPFTRAVVVMGVTSCGKSTVGEAIARHFCVPFIEGDKLHPPENIAKMSAGIPLTDEDRWPWLHQIGEAPSKNPTAN
jgi:gluconokinase